MKNIDFNIPKRIYNAYFPNHIKNFYRIKNKYPIFILYFVRYSTLPSNHLLLNILLPTVSNLIFIQVITNHCLILLQSQKILK